MATTRRFEDIVEAVQAYHPSPDLDIIERAYMYSAKVHGGQLRKSGEPYLTHPLEVAFLLTKLRLDEASLTTGLLHDTVEDTLATLDDIRNLFGAEVASLVDGVTKLSQIHFDTDEHKQAENFRKMLVAMAKDIRVILVKLADRLHNMRTLQFLAENKQRRIAQETLDIYAPIANRLGINWIKSELEDLAFAILQPQDFEFLHKKITELTVQREKYVNDVTGALHVELAQAGVPNEVQGRPKHLYSIYRKMASRQIGFEEIYDAIAFRVLVGTVGQCYEVLGHVHSMWHPIPGRFKDYIAMPKPNQYQSLHTSVIGPEGERIEIQIRTHEQHQVAEEGIAAHWEYKEAGKVGEKTRQEFGWLRRLLEWQKELQDPNEFLDTVKFDLFEDEVFVFTPRGEVISLARGATPIDFAYSIHTEVGHHCTGAKINGRMVPLRYQLKNGDMVEIVTSPQQRPSKDWLSFVHTGRAKSKIRAYVRIAERERSLEVGKDLLDRELRRSGHSVQRVLKDGLLDQLAQSDYHSTGEGLLVSIGYGRLNASVVIEKLYPSEKAPAAEQGTFIGKIIKRVTNRRSTSGVVVQGIDDMMVRFARCCNPLHGDAIVGFITRGRGITVHAKKCSRAIDADPERRIEVSWDEKETQARPVSVRVLTGDRPGILATISQTFSDNGINISQANCKVTSADRAINTFEILIKDAEQLRAVISKIKRLNGVLGVERL